MEENKFEDLLDFCVPFSSQDEVYLGMKVRLMRNIDGFLFPSRIKEEDRSKVLKFIQSTIPSFLRSAQDFLSPYPLWIQESILGFDQDVASLHISKNDKTSIACFDDHHLSATLHTSTLDLKTLLGEITVLDEKLKSSLSFAFHPQMGYLTSKAEFSGLGLEIQAYLFMPDITEVPDLDEGLTIEPCMNHEALFCLKTTQTVNSTLSATIENILKAIHLLKEMQAKAKELALKAKQDTLFDEVSKALALIKGGHQLTFDEALDYLLKIKQGYHLKMIKGIDKDQFLKLIKQSQKAHLSQLINKSESTDDWLHERSSWLKEQLKNVEAFM